MAAAIEKAMTEKGPDRRGLQICHMAGGPRLRGDEGRMGRPARRHGRASTPEGLVEGPRAVLPPSYGIGLADIRPLR